MLNNIKLLLDITDTSKDELLMLLIQQSIDDALQYTHLDSMDNIRSEIEQLVVYRFNALGAENLNSENYSGVSFNYSTYKDYRNSILNKYRRLQIW